MPTDSRTFAFISLLRDELEARGLAGLLESLARAEAVDRSNFLVPDVRGLDFFAATARQAAVDRWWAAHVPPDAQPVYLLCHEQGLAQWLHGLDGLFVIAAPPSHATPYQGWTVVDAGPAEAPLALAEATITRFGASSTTGGTGLADVFDTRDATMVAALRSDTARSWVERPRFPPLLHVAGVPVRPAPGGSTQPPDAFELLAAESERLHAGLPRWAEAAPSSTHGGAGRPWSRLRLPRGTQRRARTTRDDSELAALLVDRAPTIVAIGSRKGGVGKTSHAAGIAIVAGEVLDSVGHGAAIVDANVANPDAWGQLHLPQDAATVRDLVTALNTGAEPPPPVHSATLALACYPERRDGVEYSRTDVRRLAAHLRARYAFTVVDMSNRLPDPASGPEAAVAAYWLEEADCLVLPSASSRQDFNGVLDYLEVPNLPPTVVPYIVATARRNRRHPMTRHYLEVIGSLVDTVVEIPDEADSVRLAGMDGAAVQDVSSKMRTAYRRLTEAVARLPRGARV